MLNYTKLDDDVAGIIDPNYFTVDEYGRYVITDPLVLDAISGGIGVTNPDFDGRGTNNACQTQNTGCTNNSCRGVADNEPGDGGDDNGDDDGGDDDGGGDGDG